MLRLVHRSALMPLTALALALFAAALPAHAQKTADVPAQPEGSTGWYAKPGWHVKRYAVAAAHPLAAEGGAEMLKAGGTALDAAIAAQMVLTLVEPQSSGIGGGAFLMHWNGKALSAFDGRETAPAAADENLFMREDGRPMTFDEAVAGGRSVGTPGLLRMLAMAHAQHGRLPWARLFEPAIRLSEQGFAISHRMHALLRDEPHLRRDPVARRYFYDADGKPWPEGQVLRNPALAAVLRRVAKEGAEAFYAGDIAADIVARVRGHAGNPGLLAERDLRDYEPLAREPICTDWRADTARPWKVCGFPPPSSGHLTVMQMLGMLAPTTAGEALVDGRPGPDWLHRYTEAARLAYADRNLYIGDPAFVAAPGGDWRHLLAPDYLRARAALIGPRSMGQAQAGKPAADALAWAPQPPQPEYGTSHISVVDGEGRALALTTTIESVFGARIMSDGGTGLTGGFLLNNELTDFSLAPRDAEGKPIANRVEAGKRPRSSMSPTLVFERQDGRLGRLVMTLGSPGGQAIIHFVAKTLVATHDWELDVQRALALPNFGSFNGPTVLEQGLFAPTTGEALRARGHRVVERDFTSGLQAIERRGDGWFGGADPRREGAVRGE